MAVLDTLSDIKKAQLRERGEVPTRYDDATHVWDAAPRNTHEKGIVWFIVTTLIVGVLVAYSIYAKNWFFLAAVVMAVAVYVIDEIKPAKKIQIKLSEFGVKIGKTLIPFSGIKRFWLAYHPPHMATLNLQLHKHFMSEVSIELEDQDPAKIRALLSRHVVEWSGKDESLIDICTRLLKL